MTLSQLCDFAFVLFLLVVQEELMEVVTVMKGLKSSYTKLNVRMPSGVLLSGPPGTGKTLLGMFSASQVRRLQGSQTATIPCA